MCCITLNKIYRRATSGILICTQERILNAEMYKQNWIRPLCLCDKTLTLIDLNCLSSNTESRLYNKCLQNYRLVIPNTSKTEQLTISVQNVKSATVIFKVLQKTQMDYFYILKSLEKSKMVSDKFTRPPYEITYVSKICLNFFYFFIKTVIIVVPRYRTLFINYIDIQFIKDVRDVAFQFSRTHNINLAGA